MTKKSPFGAAAGPVKKLRRQDDVSRVILFLQASNSSDANYPANIKRAQGENVGTMVQLGRQEPVPARMPRQKVNLAPVGGPSDQAIGGFPERSIDTDLFQVLKAFNLIEATAPDDADCCRLVAHALARLRKKEGGVNRRKRVLVDTVLGVKLFWE